MEKIVTSGDRDCTVQLDGTECSVKFDSCYRAYSVQNNSTSDVFVSVKQGASAGDDGVMRIKAGCSAVFAHMRLDVDTVYFNGTGEIQIHGQNDTNNSFHNAPAANSGGEAVDAYTKSESDARYAAIADVVPYKMGMDFGTCTTAAETAVKTVTTLNKSAPLKGAVFAIKFTNAVQANAMLNINGLSGYMQYRGGNLPSGVINAGDVVTFMYYANSGFNRFEILSIENVGNAKTVNGHTVNADVPENAVFTDTVPDLSGYAKLTDIPSSLPANGGNADTVDGKHASELVSALTLNNVVNNYAAIPNNVDIAEWLVENAKIGTTYIRNDANVGQTNLPGDIDRWTYITYDGNRYLARVLLTPDSTTDFLLDYIYYPDGVNIKGWKEISATPLKSMTVSGTTNSFSDLALFTMSSGKIPVFIACDDVYCIPCSSTTGAYYAHMIPAHRDSMANVAIDSATVYYIQT